MNESRLKATTSFASETTVQQSQHAHHKQQHKRDTTGTSTTDTTHDEKQRPHSFAPDEASTKQPFVSRFKSTALTLLKKYWFLLGLAFVIILATQVPDVARKDGYIHAEWTIKWGNVMFDFFLVP